MIGSLSLNALENVESEFKCLRGNVTIQCLKITVDFVWVKGNGTNYAIPKLALVEQLPLDRNSVKLSIMSRDTSGQHIQILEVISVA